MKYDHTIERIRSLRKSVNLYKERKNKLKLRLEFLQEKKEEIMKELATLGLPTELEDLEKYLEKMKKSVNEKIDELEKLVNVEA